MEKLLISILFVLCISQSLQTSDESVNSEDGGAVKRDVSISYAATDVGSHKSHVKTLTVIKNVVNHPKQNSDIIVKLWQNDDKNNGDKIKIPDIPQIPDLFSEFHLYLHHDYVSKTEEKTADDKKENNPETDKLEEKNTKTEIDSKKEELSNDGVIAGEDLLNANAEEIKETNENVKSQKSKPADEKFYISSPILPEQAERSAKAQKQRHQTKVDKPAAEETKEIFEEQNENNKNYELPYVKLFEPNNEKKSESLLQLPISFDDKLNPSSDKTVFHTKPTYSKKVYQSGVLLGQGYKRDAIFIPKFSSSNYKTIKK